MMVKDAFTFLITTDNHMGFKEDDHIRRKDSYMAFEEALKVARERDVDFILLGGDLFHMNRPSPSIEHKCIKIIRQHMNAPASRGTSFTRIKGQFSHFHKLNHANFEDNNLTVPYPIMTIHGNHDDPTGPNAQSVCVKLATCGLLNYFGALKPNVKSIIIEPIILQKNSVKIALYGLGFISDLKLKQAFDKGEVVFLEPPPDTYNILVVHQNRIPYNKAKYIPDDLFPLNFHLIIRGHEHDAQKPEPILGSEVGGLVYQPGSTVATSISSYEARPKKVGVFSIEVNKNSTNLKNKFNVNYELVELKCCRKMVVKDIAQKDVYTYIKAKLGTRVTATDFKRLSQEYVTLCLEKLLEEINPNSSESDKQNMDIDNCGGDDDDDDYDKKKSRLAIPLLRVRLEYSIKSERFDELDVSSKFYPNRVANKDIISYKKQKLIMGEDGEMINNTFSDTKDDQLEDEDYDEFDHINLGEEKRDIDIMIESYFKDKPPSDRLQALSLTEYTNAVRGTGEDGNVISKVLNAKKQEVLNKYKRHIKDDKIADKFMHEENVRKWFLDIFRKDLDCIDISDGEETEEDEKKNVKVDDDDDDDDSMDVVVCN